MGRLFSVSSWNVEHFSDDPTRVDRVADFISGNDGGPATVPEIFALLEVEGKEIYRTFMQRFPDYRFHMTEGEETQEIFIGVHRNLQTFSTQRLEFKNQREAMRPGLLLSVRTGQGNDYTLLFLHAKSGDTPEDFGMRDTGLNHAFNLKKALDTAYGGQANFIVAGDFNSMGINDPCPYCKEMDLAWEKEVDRMSFWAGKRDMVLLDKEPVTYNGNTVQATWWNGGPTNPPTGLDHVFAAKHLDIRADQNTPGIVKVLGWPKKPQSQWANWFANYSDHAMLYFEVWE